MQRLSLLAVLLLVLLSANIVAGQDQVSDFPPEVRQWFRNPDGSCVQCSIGMCGVWQNVPEASTLLWDTEYGPRVRGGSNPSRVEAYADRRHIPMWNVTGSNTWDWMKWACKSGRMVAIGCFSSHFQTLVWFNPDPSDQKPWKVCNNNSPTRVDEYTESEFRRHHLASGQWVVVLKSPPPPALPQYVAWWDPKIR